MGRFLSNAWLSGFIDGEGCFLLSRVDGQRSHGRIVPIFVIGLSDRDEDILREICVDTQIGAIYKSRKDSHRHEVRWSINTKSDTLVLRDYLNRFPLQTKKSEDFGLWSEAIDIWQNIRQGMAGVSSPNKKAKNAPYWEKIWVLRDELIQQRKRHQNGK